jgi:hypothetical protein
MMMMMMIIATSSFIFICYLLHGQQRTKTKPKKQKKQHGAWCYDVHAAYWHVAWFLCLVLVSGMDEFSL